MRDGLPWFLLAIAIGVLAWTHIGASEAKHEARAHEIRADSLQGVADSMATARAEAAQLDSSRYAALIDSADARASRAENARRREAESRERAEAARARATAAADSLTQTLTPEQVPLFDAYRAERDAEVSEIRAELASVQARLEDSEATGARLWEARESVAALYQQATDEVEVLRSEVNALRDANEAVWRAANATNLENRWLRAVGALAVGLGIYREVTR